MSRANAIQIFEAAVEAVQPQQLMQQHLYADEEYIHIAGYALRKSSINNVIVIAVGKAAAAMAQQAELQLGNIITNGICITKYEHGLPLQTIQLLEAAHPVPDENSIKAGEAVLRLINGLTKDDVVLVLISGGASSLMADVPEGCTITDVQTCFELLLNSGATIHEMNAVRKHLSKIKGGQLAKAAQPAKVFSLILSDVVGDDTDTIASGPTVPDRSTFTDAQEILLKYKLWDSIPAAIRNQLTRGLQQQITETPSPGELFFQNTFTQIIGSNRIALQEAATKAKQLGYHTIIYKENVTEDAEQFARTCIQQFIHYTGVKPACILCGGETTVKVTGNGKGGRNQHLVLCALDELSKQKKLHHVITVLSGGTDGTDGPTDAAGAVADSNSLPDDLLLKKCLADCNAYHYFEQTGGLLKTGPTQTNVMDVMLLLIE
jgi:glycerate 2-kinase